MSTPSAFKRHRALSDSSSTSSVSEHTSKASRVTPVPEDNGGSGAPLLCTLPPTCNHRPTPIANTKDLEAHYANYHAHVCEQDGCGCVFPDARLLNLHQTECHDPLAAVRKDRGEKIFACHLATCPRLFQTPKARRLHLIQAHQYPKQYFFAVTNKGVGGLLKRWGEGVSMVRKEWKPRDEKKDKGKEISETEMRDAEEEADDSDDEEEEEDEMEEEDDDDNDEAAQATPRVQPRAGLGNADDAYLDTLADSMSSLALVPPAVRFGRGGAKGGFVHTPAGHRGYHPDAPRGAGRGRDRGRGGVVAGNGIVGMVVDPRAQGQGQWNGTGNGIVHPSANGRGRALGWAGRGRAGFIHPRGILPVRGQALARGMPFSRGAAIHRGRGRGGVPHPQ